MSYQQIGAAGAAGSAAAYAPLPTSPTSSYNAAESLLPSAAAASPASTGTTSFSSSPAPAAAFPTAAAHFSPGSNFYIHLCCAWSTPWFMVGRVAHRLGHPSAWALSAGALLLTAGTFIPFSTGSDPALPLTAGERVLLLLAALAFACGLFVLTAVVRSAFRSAQALPGTFLEDLALSTSWVLCLPCYAPPTTRPTQCSYAFQLALMEGALAEAAVQQQQQQQQGGGGQGQGFSSGAAKEGAMHPFPQQIPLQQRSGAPGQFAAAGGAQAAATPKWSTDLWGCTCNNRCEGDVPLCACSAAYGWWMQTRLMRRMGRTQDGDFWKVALLFFFCEGLPDLWDIIAGAAQVATAAADVLGVVARLPVVLINMWLRRVVRDRYGIPENFMCEDCVISFFCYPCAIAQQVRVCVCVLLPRMLRSPSLAPTSHAPAFTTSHSAAGPRAHSEGRGSVRCGMGVGAINNRLQLKKSPHTLPSDATPHTTPPPPPLIALALLPSLPPPLLPLLLPARAARAALRAAECPPQSRPRGAG
jgi:Cys-rich protein (TIGR01571 family)